MVFAKFNILTSFLSLPDKTKMNIFTPYQRRDSTDGRAAALYPADPGSNPVVSMLQRALCLSVSAGRQTQLIMNRSWSQTLIVALLHWLDYKTLQLLLQVVSKSTYPSPLLV